MGAQIVQNDQVTGMKLGRKDLLDESSKDRRVCAALDRHDGTEAGQGQGAQDGGDGSSVTRYHGVNSLAPRGTPILTGHRHVAACFINEYQLGWIQARELLEKLLSELLGLWSQLLAGNQRLFFYAGNISLKLDGDGRAVQK